jgi:hypothetical protein
MANINERIIPVAAGGLFCRNLPPTIGELLVIDHHLDRPIPAGSTVSIGLVDRGVNLVRGVS